MPATVSPPASANDNPPVSPDVRLRRLRFRAWHRGTREADFMIGGFFDAHVAGAGDGDAVIEWFERLLDHDDVDIMAWAIGTQPVPAHFAGPIMERMQALDYIRVT